jgi:hypothetical protein
MRPESDKQRPEKERQTKNATQKKLQIQMG